MLLAIAVLAVGAAALSLAAPPSASARKAIVCHGLTCKVVCREDLPNGNTLFTPVGPR